MRRYNRPVDTSLITCSLSANVGFLRAMSFDRFWSVWFARGSTWSLNQTITRVSALAATITGTIRRRIDSPLALKAVISFSAAILLNACSVETSTAMGRVIATVNGTESSMNSAMTPGDSPLPTSWPSCLAT